MYVSRTNFIQSEYRASARPPARPPPRVFVSRLHLSIERHLHSGLLAPMPDAVRSEVRIIFPIRYKYKRLYFSKGISDWTRVLCENAYVAVDSGDGIGSALWIRANFSAPPPPHPPSPRGIFR